ncbi:MAG: efflux RND transporter periplasmic adaptor subunit [Bythopirellula sp.]
MSTQGATDAAGPFNDTVKLSAVVAMNVGHVILRTFPPKCLFPYGMVCLLVVSAGCDLPEEPALVARLDLEEGAALPVNVARISLSENVFQAHLTYGMVRPHRSSALGFQRGGQISTVYFDVGERVPEGEKIAELEQEELVAQQTELDESLSTRRDQLAEYTRRNNVQQMTRLRNEIAALETQQDELTRNVQQGIVVAPYAVVLAGRDANEGDMVPSGRPLFRIAEDTQPIIQLQVNSRLAAELEVGSAAWIRRGDTLQPAQVATRSPELDPSSRTQQLTLELPDESDVADWIFGDTVEVLFWTPTATSGFWVPYSALHREENGLWTVFVVNGASDNPLAERRIVEVGQLEDQQALVSGTLNDGDLLVVDGLHRLVPGQRVQSTLVTSEFATPGPPGAGE